MVFVLGTSGNNVISPFSVSPGVLGIPGAGADTIDGGAGADIMDGGDGDDLYIVDNIGDIVRESFDDALGGFDTVLASVSYSLAPGTFGNRGFGIENLLLTGGANINATGNAKNNVLIGNSGNNTLNSGAGNDILGGSNGNDIMIEALASSAADLTWRGNGTDNNWDITTTANWWNGTSLVTFTNGDNVTFDDSGTNNAC